MVNFECVFHVTYIEEPDVSVTMICMTDLLGRLSFDAPMLAGVNLVWAGMVPMYTDIPILYTRDELVASNTIYKALVDMPVVKSVELIYFRHFDEPTSIIYGDQL